MSTRPRAPCAVRVIGMAPAFTVDVCRDFGERLERALDEERWGDAGTAWLELERRGPYRVVVNASARRAIARWVRATSPKRRKASAR